MALEAICPSRLMPDATSRGQILRVIAMKRTLREELSLREDGSLARMKASRGCHLSRESIGLERKKSDKA